MNARDRRAGPLARTLRTLGALVAVCASCTRTVRPAEDARGSDTVSLEVTNPGVDAPRVDVGRPDIVTLDATLPDEASVDAPAVDSQSFDTSRFDAPLSDATAETDTGVLNIDGCVITPCQSLSAWDVVYRHAADPYQEARESLDTIVAGAVAYASAVRADGGAPMFPATVGLTPPAIPAAVCVYDPAGIWNAVTWRALRFGVYEFHRFAYEFASAGSGAGATFRARAYGNFDGMGTASTFERSGAINARLEVDVSPLRIYRACE